MRRVYQPPPSGRHRFLVILCALGLTALVFLTLPLTRIFTSVEETVEDRPARVDLTPPPPPPPEEDPPPETDEATEIPEEAPPAPEREVEPIPFEQLELALDPDPGAALTGDFSFEFNLFADTGGAFETFEVSELDQTPRTISRTPPLYPYAMRRDRIEGTVTLVFVIDENGRVIEPRVESSTRREFERPALDAVRQWRFEPGIRDGEPVRTLVRTPIEFTLD